MHAVKHRVCFLKIYYYFLLNVCVSPFIGTCTGQKRMSGPLELEQQVFMSHLTWL